MCTGLIQISKAICVSGMEMSHEPALKVFSLLYRRKKLQTAPEKTGCC